MIPLWFSTKSRGRPLVIREAHNSQHGWLWMLGYSPFINLGSTGFYVPSILVSRTESRHHVYALWMCPLPKATTESNKRFNRKDSIFKMWVTLTICQVREDCYLTVQALRRENILDVYLTESPYKQATFVPSRSRQPWPDRGSQFSIHIEKYGWFWNLFSSVLGGQEIIVRKHYAFCSCSCIA